MESAVLKYRIKQHKFSRDLNIIFCRETFSLYKNTTYYAYFNSPVLMLQTYII